MEPTTTRRQLEILRFIRDYRHRLGYSPTMQEIGDHLDLTKVTVFEHVGSLEKKGLVLRGGKHRARSLRVSPSFKFEDERPTKFPLAGRIAAGLPIEAVEQQQMMDLEELFAGQCERFSLQVTGQSMIEDHISDGDLVICEKRSNPKNGDTVVALLANSEATLKRFFKEKDRIRLQPANSEFKPIYVQPGEINIQGVVIGVVRKI